MDETLRQLHQQYQISGDPELKEELDHYCERLDLLGPSLAEACNVLSRLHDAILKRQGVFQSWAANDFIRLARLLRNVSWSALRSELNDADDPNRSGNITFMLRTLWEYLENTFEDLTTIPSFSKYVGILFPLLLFLLYKHKYQLKEYDGVKGVCLEKLTPKEFAEKIESVFGSRDQRSSFLGLAAVVEAGYAEVYSNKADADEYEGLAALLPEMIQNKLKSLWDQEEYPSFGDFLEEEFGDAFNTARYTGMEVGTFNEMFQLFSSVIDAVSWKSGAVATQIDVETIEIWIATKDLEEAIKTFKANPFYDLDFLLEEPEVDIFIKDNFYDFDEEAAKERLLEELPMELTEDI